MHSKMESVSKQDPANQQSGLEQKRKDDNLKNRRIFTEDRKNSSSSSNLQALKWQCHKIC